MHALRRNRTLALLTLAAIHVAGVAAFVQAHRGRDGAPAACVAGALWLALWIVDPPVANTRA